jgi:BA14K-like protein
MLNILRTVCAVLVMAATFPITAQAQTHDAAGSARIGAVPVGGPRFAAAPRYYGGIYRGAAWPGRYGSYGDWRQSYSPYWAWDVAAGLVATAPTYYYYGVGFGDEFGYEAPLYDDAIAYCMQRFRSYDPITGTYLGRGGYRYPCP